MTGTAGRIVLTVEEAAHCLGIGRTLMYTLVMEGEVESVRIGRLRRIPTDALDTYVLRLRSCSGAVCQRPVGRAGDGGAAA